jgi:hypothetical protein
MLEKEAEEPDIPLLLLSTLIALCLSLAIWIRGRVMAEEHS